MCPLCFNVFSVLSPVVDSISLHISGGLTFVYMCLFGFCPFIHSLVETGAFCLMHHVA